jgi:nitrogen fixation protein FixH
MSPQRSSKTTLSWKQVLIFIVVEFVVVFGVLVTLQFLSLTSYALVVAGAVAGASVVVNLILNRRAPHFSAEYRMQMQ